MKTAALIILALLVFFAAWSIVTVGKRFDEQFDRTPDEHEEFPGC